MLKGAASSSDILGQNWEVAGYYGCDNRLLSSVVYVSMNVA